MCTVLHVPYFECALHTPKVYVLLASDWLFLRHFGVLIAG